jgi:hypothetical protein
MSLKMNKLAGSFLSLTSGPLLLNPHFAVTTTRCVCGSTGISQVNKISIGFPKQSQTEIRPFHAIISKSAEPFKIPNTASILNPLRSSHHDPDETELEKNRRKKKEASLNDPMRKPSRETLILTKEKFIANVNLFNLSILTKLN